MARNLFFLVPIVLVVGFLASGETLAQKLQAMKDSVGNHEPISMPSSKVVATHSGETKISESGRARLTHDGHQRWDAGEALEDSGKAMLDDIGSRLANRIMAPVFTSPFWIPRAIAQETDYRHGYFLEYPFQDQWGGLTEVPLSENIWTDTLLRLRLDAGTNFDDLRFTGGQLLFDAPWRFGIDSEFGYWQEDTIGFEDHVWIGDINFVYRFAQSPRLQARAGIGANYLVDDVESNWGLNLTYSTDLFLKPPFIASLEADLGSLGESSRVHFRGSLGACRGPAEVFVGYDYLATGGENVSSLVAGLRFWF